MALKCGGIPAKEFINGYSNVNVNYDWETGGEVHLFLIFIYQSNLPILFIQDNL